MSVENNRFLLKPESGFLTQSKKSSTGFSDSTFSTDFFDRQILSKKSVENVFLNPSRCSSHHEIFHTHTKYQKAVSYNSADAGVTAVTAVASRRKSARRIPSSARQQRVSHDGSSVRYQCHIANNGYACCSSGGFRLSATPRP